uniref:Putative tropomyosin n=1 Tax=Ixodes ricinus TaxID=34613 RepID=A0A0K8RCJ5_IXORI
MALGGCLVPGELCEGLVQFVRDSFVLLFLLDKLVFQSVHFLLELLHRPLSKFGSRFGLLEPTGHLSDLALVGLLLLQGLLLTDFQGLQVVANHSQLLLKLHNFAFLPCRPSPRLSPGLPPGVRCGGPSLRISCQTPPR